MSIEPYYRDDTVTLLLGDALTTLQDLPSGSVTCIVTSPPYFGLRDYGAHGQYGLEATPAEYVETMRTVFAEARRVLAADGTLWLNLGDSYSNASSSGTVGATAKVNATCADVQQRASGGDRSPKSLLMIPERVALALQDDGWILRNKIVWHKPNAMPESVRDRLSKRYEEIFLLSKSARYSFDLDALREPSTYQGRTWEERKRLGEPMRYGTAAAVGARGFDPHEKGRNPGDVWSIPTRPYPAAHFACVDEETECLTAEGWKPHSDVRAGELAAQFDMETQQLSWGVIEAVARYEVTDQVMVVGRRRAIDMWLTPNHRTIIQRRHPRTRALQPPVIVRADQVLPSHSIPTTAPWVDGGATPISREWAELLGWYIAEGHENKRSLALEIYQSCTANPQHVERIEYLLNAVGAEWEEARSKRQWRGRPSESVAFRIHGFVAARLRELAPGKSIPVGALLWSQDLVSALMDGLINGDGHTRKDDGRLMFIQKDPQRAGMVQALAIRLGLSATMSRHSSGTHQVFLTQHRTRSFRGTAGEGSALDREQYTGTVWCPRLPNGTWVARRNGQVFITGNTFPIDLPIRCIKAGCKPGGTVLDPFSGSGTTGAAARQLGRKYIGIDLNPAYHDLAKQRFAQAVLDFGEAS